MLASDNTICSFCAKHQTRRMVHVCEAEEGCEALVCDRCWVVFNRRFCPEHTKTSQLRLGGEETLNKNAALSWDTQSNIFFQNAKAQEVIFFERLKTEFSDLSAGENLYHPRTENPVSLKGKLVKEGHEESLIPFNLIERKEKLPSNRYAVYSINLPKGDICPHGMTSVLVEARCLFWGNSPEEGIFKPKSKHELLALLDSKARINQRQGTFTVLGLFSPTGWDEEAAQSVCGKERFISPNLAPILISDSVLNFDKDSVLSAFFAQFFNFELLRDRVKNCKEAIENELIGVQYVSLENLRSNLRYPATFIEKVMLEMARNNDFIVFEEEKDIGKILRRRR